MQKKKSLLERKNTIIMGASGRDFSNFLVFFKDNPYYNVVAFTQNQIPGIENGSFPKQLAGKFYKKNIPFYLESELPMLIKKFKVEKVFLCYSDLSHQAVMEKASLVLASGADFELLGIENTHVKSKKPVIAVLAVRTGCGKSQTSRAIANILRKKGKKVIPARHGMPYGNLLKQTCQRFESEKDFKKYDVTIEELEEYQPWIDHGFIVYSGFDYKEIVKQAEKEGNILLMDGGNNDMSFIKPDLRVVVTDPHRPGHELTYYPGFINFLGADVIIINKIDSAKKEGIKTIEENIKKYNPTAKVVHARSEIIVKNSKLIKGKSVLVVGDGPSLTHGGTKFGAGTLAVKKYGGKLVDARKYAINSIKKTYEKYLHLKNELPAMGYSKKQIKELEKTISKTPCDIIIDGTPANLKNLIKTNKPIVEVDYELGKGAVKKLESILKKKKFI
jgi:predicted GTPase